MGWLGDYRKKRQERRRKRDRAQSEARKSLRDEPLQPAATMKIAPGTVPADPAGFKDEFLHTLDGPGATGSVGRTIRMLLQSHRGSLWWREVAWVVLGVVEIMITGVLL